MYYTLHIQGYKNVSYIFLAYAFARLQKKMQISRDKEHRNHPEFIRHELLS